MYCTRVGKRGGRGGGDEEEEEEEEEKEEERHIYVNVLVRWFMRCNT
jgi:hypothetical protein